jgi:hypothetical protein
VPAPGGAPSPPPALPEIAPGICAAAFNEIYGGLVDLSPEFRTGAAQTCFNNWCNSRNLAAFAANRKEAPAKPEPTPEEPNAGDLPF